MSKRAGRARARWLAFAVAMSTAFALMVPFVGTAAAQPPAGCTLNVEPETDSNPIGQPHTLTATLVDANPADAQTCTAQDINAAGGVEVDAEITGPGDPDNGDTPETPDLTCTITGTGQTQTSCVLGPYTSNTAGTDTIRAFVDADKNNANNATEADMTEGQNEATAPGAQTEPDRTDVATKTWFGDIPANATLDCVDESGDDTQVNPVSGPDATETYTCTVFQDADNDGTFDQGEQVVQGVAIDAEIQGVNDPDDRGFNDPANTTADRDNACTTDAQGRCTIQIAPAENQAGTAQICFFTDADNDNTFAAEGTENSGGQCGEENAGTEATDRRTDVVTKTWAQAGPGEVDVAPDVANNVAGTQHTVTVTVRDQFGNPVAGQNVDLYVRGRNTIDQQNLVTNQQGQVTFAYTDTGPANQEGQDTITACVDADQDNTFTEVPAQGGNTAQVNCETGELEDDALKNWFPQGQLPTPAAIAIDMTPAAAPNECPDQQNSNDFTNTATNTVGDAPHEFCVTVFDQTGEPIQGQEVTLSISGPGNFTNEAGTQDTAQQTTVTTDREGDASAFIESNQSGTATITATAGNQTTTATKEFVSSPALAREIDCNPETATNPPGTTHTITCVVTDRFGNRVQGVTVTATEDGPGRFTTGQGPVNDLTDANGVAEFVVTTSANETGIQTITASLPGNRTDANVEECERPADSPTGTTAGVCSDHVTKTWGGTAAPTTTANPTVTTTATVTAPPTGFPRTVFLESAKNKRTFGRTITLTGAVTSDDANIPASCLSNVNVTILRDVVGGPENPVVIATVTTGPDGTFSYTRKADRSANYIAHLDQDAQCAEANSEPESVLVRVAVGLRLSTQRVHAGGVVRLRGKIRPCGGHKRDRLVLFRVVGGKLAKVEKKRMNNKCVAVFRQRVRRNTAFQVRWPKQHPDHLRGKSRKKAVIVR